MTRLADALRNAERAHRRAAATHERAVSFWEEQGDYVRAMREQLLSDADRAESERLRREGYGPPPGEGAREAGEGRQVGGKPHPVHPAHS